MDVNGLLVAASEIIRFEQGDAVLLTFWNEKMEFSFYVLNDVSSAHVWNVQVNKIYKLTNLKVGCLEMVSGRKLILFKTRPKSSYFEIHEKMNSEFIIVGKLKELLTSSKTLEGIGTKFKSESTLICYEGVVTNVKASYGVFELDDKTILYTSYNNLRAKMSAIKVGSKLFISNAHLIYNGCKPLLVCCGLSSVKIISSSGFEEENDYVDYFVLKNKLSIYDVLWIESLSEILQRKFFSLIPVEEISFDINKDLLENLLSALMISQNQLCSAEKFSVVEEYCSYPHACLPFSVDQIPKACDILSIKDIIKETNETNTWIQISEHWCISIAENISKVLIGILYLSEKGCLFIEDSSFSIPVVLVTDCVDCSFHENILQKFNTPDFSMLVILQDYKIVHENIKFKSNTCDYSMYIRTSPCCILPLKAFSRLHKKSASLSDAFSRQLTIQEKFRYESFNCKPNFLSLDTLFLTDSNQAVEQKILILCKLWLSNAETSVCSSVLALTLPQESNSINISFENNSFNFYETEDDIEFANLVNGIDSICINNVPKLISLCSEEESESNVLYPGHIYSVGINDISSIENSKHVNHTVENCIFSMKMKSGCKIKLDSFIKDDDSYLADVKYYGIKEIILKNQIPPNSFIRGVLIDKFLKENSGSINCEKSLKKRKNVLCLCLRDIEETDTLFVYIPLHLRDVSGLLPSAVIDLYGFQCIRSQKGYLYLRASPVFGIEVSSYVMGNRGIMSMSENKLPHSAERDEIQRFYMSACVFQKCLKQICFIPKLVSAELSLSCQKCFKEIQETCACSFPYLVKVKACAIIDDGRIQLLCDFREDTVRKLLELDVEAWQCLISSIEQTHIPLKYNEKMDIKDISLLPLMNQIFWTYCSNGCVKQQMLLSFYVLPSSASNRDPLFRAHCVDIDNITVNECLMELYVNIKQVKDHDLIENGD